MEDVDPGGDQPLFDVINEYENNFQNKYTGLLFLGKKITFAPFLIKPLKGIFTFRILPVRKSYPKEMNEISTPKLKSSMNASEQWVTVLLRKKVWALLPIIV